MMSFVPPLGFLIDWLRTSGLEVVLLALIAVLASRLVRRIGQIVVVRMDKDHERENALVRSERSKHLHSLVQVLVYVAIACIYVVTLVGVLERFGVKLSSLVAPAAVLGAALGFGAQRIVQDFLAGFFLITERQYGFGDTVEIMATGAGEPAMGTVVDVTLRVTKLRTLNGELVTIPNGQVVKSTNMSRDWAQSLIDIPVPANADVAEVSDILQQVCHEAMDDPRVAPLLLGSPVVTGVERLELEKTSLRILARCLPGKQWEVGRRLRAMISRRLREANITLSPEALAGLRAGMLRGNPLGDRNE